MAHRPASYLRVALLGALVATALHGTIRLMAAADLEQHVELSVQLLELSVAEWGERAAVPPASDTDEETRAAALAAVEKKFKSERARLYESYVTSASEHLAFFAKHAADVDEYLADHPETKNHIESLNQTLRSLITSDESKGAEAAGGRP